MKKRVRSNYYTIEKRVRTADGHEWVSLPGGRLFAGGIYPSNVTEADLPDTFVELLIRGEKSYLNAAGVKDLRYKPNYFSDNHLFKDDFLYISYSEPLKEVKDKTGYTHIDEYDRLLWGYSIVSFVEAVKEKTDFPVDNILEEIHKKQIWYVRTNPTHPELSNCNMPCHPGVILLTRDMSALDPRFTEAEQEKEAAEYCNQHSLVYNGTVPYSGDAVAFADVLKARRAAGEDVCFVLLPLGPRTEGEREYGNTFERAFRGRIDGVVVDWMYLHPRENE